MRVYNLSSEIHALSNIKNSRIKVATIEDLNDPFELNAAKQPDKRMRRVFRGFKGDMHAKFGLICFSKVWSNPVMWSHYADKHKGICLGFDVPEDYLIKVEYVDSRIAIEFDDESKENINSNFVQKLFSTKFIDWSYEKEKRMFVTLEETDEESENYFYPFGDDLVLREVILGSRSTSSVKEILNILGATKEVVTVQKSRLAFHLFNVVRDKKVSIQSTMIA